jgi:adenine-specific DNA-methyltransferase
MKVSATSQKLRGGYYTPSTISDFLVRWAVQRASDSVLEPSCGDGAFVESLLRRWRALGASAYSGHVVAVELDAEEAAKARARLGVGFPHAEVLTMDFFQYCRDTLFPDALWEAQAPRFDAVVGNPPFIRYQAFPDAHREIAFQLMRRAGLHPNKLTNAWVAFLVCAAMALADDGRLAMVIPAELLQVNYAAEVRRFLSEFFQRITIITFRCLVFPEIQQEVVLLLAERTAGESHGIWTVELRDASDLERFDFFESLNGQLKHLDHTNEKWTKYFLPNREILLLRRLRVADGVFRLQDVAEVDVGVVTGENDFFILRPSQARTLNISSVTERVISRSSQLVGLTLTESDWRNLEAEDSRVLLFRPGDREPDQLPKAVCEYIRSGEARGQDRGYKCRIRRLWYAVPSVWTPDAFALRQVHLFPKIVINEARGTSTDTVHRVRFKSGVSGRQVAGAFLNSMTLAFAETMGRSYGGGVLTFEPSEVEALPIPLLGSEHLDLEYIEERLRGDDIYAVLDHTDDVLLRQHLGLDHREMAGLRTAWERLRDRRIARKMRTRPMEIVESVVAQQGPVVDESITDDLEATIV